MVQAIRCHRQNMKTSIINGSEVSRLSVAIQIWDAQGKAVDVFNHPLTGAYLNSFTLDMLRSGESSKSSIFAKLSRLMVEN